MSKGLSWHECCITLETLRQSITGLRTEQKKQLAGVRLACCKRG